MKRIHINSNIIKSNAKHGKNDPAITIRRGQKVETYAHEVIIDGPSRVVYRPDKPLSCGAKVWIETEATVIPVYLDEVAEFGREQGESNELLDTCQVDDGN